MEVKVFIVLAFLAAKAVVTRSAVKSSPQATPSQSHFSYGVDDDKTGNKFTHQQATNGLATQGEYRVDLPDGRTQVVSYRADENGYNAVVTYEGVAVHPDDETAASNIVTRPPVPSTAHPSRQRPVIAIPSVSHPPERFTQKRRRVHTASPLPDLQRQFPIFPQSDLGIDVPIFDDQEDLQSVDHPIPSLPPVNQFLRRPPKFRRSEPVVPKPTVVPTGIPAQPNFVEPHSNAHGSPFFPNSQGKQFPVNDFSQFHSQFDSDIQNLPVIHEQPTLHPHTDFTGLSDPFLPSDVDLNNIFIDIPKINPRLPNGGSFPTTTDLSLFVPEEDLQNGNFPGLVSNTLPIFQFPVNSHNGFDFVQDQPVSFSVTPTQFPSSPIRDHVTTVRHHGTPVHERIHLPPQPVIPVPQHGTPSPFTPSFTHHVSGAPFQGSGGHHGLLQHGTSLPRHGLSTPQHSSFSPNHVIDIPRQGTTVPVHNHNIQATALSARDRFLSHIDHGIPINDQSSFTHDVSPVSFHHPSFRPSTPSFLFNQSPTTPLSQHVNPTPLQSNFVSRQGTPHPQVTSPVSLQSNTFLPQGTPFPLVTSAAPQHEVPLIQHGTPVSLISSPAPQGNSPLHLGSLIPGTSSPFPQHGSLRPIITNPTPFPGGSISHGRTPVPSFTRPAPTHAGTVSRLGNPGPLLTTLTPLQETSVSQPSPISRFSSPAPQFGFASQAPHFNNPASVTGSPLTLFSTPSPHFDSPASHSGRSSQIPSAVPHHSTTFSGASPLISSPSPRLSGPPSHLGSSFPVVSRPLPEQVGFNILNRTPVSHITSPFPRPLPEQVGFNIPNRTPVSHITSPVPRPLPEQVGFNIPNRTPASHITSPVPGFGSPPPHINQISSPVTPAPPFLSTTFRPSVSRAPFIPSPFDNQVSLRPIQNGLGPKNELPPPSANRVGGRRRKIPKTLSPFQPGEETLDREQFLRHKGISARSVRSPLKKPKTKTKS